MRFAPLALLAALVVAAPADARVVVRFKTTAASSSSNLTSLVVNIGVQLEKARWIYRLAARLTDWDSH